jgi:hypothetical protein
VATSFGDNGGAPNLKRIVTNPIVLGAAAVAVLLAIFIWKRSSGQTSNVGSQLQPATSAATQSADQFGLATSGLQQELSNLVAQWSNSIQGLQDQQNQLTGGSANNVPSGAYMVNIGHPGVSLQSGAGYNVGETVTSGGHTFFHLLNPSAAAAYAGGGGTEYYFAQPGVAVPIPAGQFPQGGTGPTYIYGIA